MAFYGLLWPFMAFYGLLVLWLFDGLLWPFMAFYGLLCFFVVDYIGQQTTSGSVWITNYTDLHLIRCSFNHTTVKARHSSAKLGLELGWS